MTRKEKYMTPEERKQKIIDIAAQKKFVRVGYLTQTLYTSEATIRRDLSQLEKAGYIMRTNGGAMYLKETYHEFPFDYKARTNAEKKKYIADLAIDFVGSFQSIFMDSSSTCSYLAKKMVHQSNLTILCNGVTNCQILSQNPQIKVHCPAGVITHDTDTITGQATVDYVEKHSAQIAFISCRGLDADFGLSEIVESEAYVKQAFRKRASQVVLLADSTKFGTRFFFQSLPLDQINTFISDSKPPEDILHKMKECNIEVIY